MFRIMIWNAELFCPIYTFLIRLIIISSDYVLHGSAAHGVSDLLVFIPPTLSLFAAGKGGFGGGLCVESGERT